jgi:site-specific DNA recombinase
LIWIACEIKTRDRYGRPVGICYADHIDIGGALVERGHFEPNCTLVTGRDGQLGVLAPEEIRAILIALLSRVDIRPDRVEIKVPRRQLIEQLHAQSIASSTAAGKPDSASDDTLTLTVKARLQRVGRELRMLVENTDDQTTADPGLLRIVARAHDIQARLIQDTELTVHMIARQERVSANYVYRLLRIPSLAPDIITAIINGKNPPQLTAKRLMRLTPQIPVGWAEQRKLSGFQ